MFILLALICKALIKNDGKEGQEQRNVCFFFGSLTSLDINKTQGKAQESAKLSLYSNRIYMYIHILHA